MVLSAADCHIPPQSREAYASLEAKAEAALRLAADLRRQQNALAPVHRLSDDALFHVFSFLVQPVGITPVILTPIGFRDVIRVNRVCSRWRKVALSPLLWTEIPAHTLPQVKAFLSRSNTAPVSVAMKHLPGVTAEEIESVLSPHLNRTRALGLSLATASDMRGCMSWLAGPAPQLETLTLWLREAPMRGPLPMDDWPCWKDGSSFGEHLTALRSLTLHGIHFPAGSPIFRRLTDLCISGQPASLLNSVTAGRILAHMPQLETLCISFLALSEEEEDIQTRTPFAELPHLRKLEVLYVPVEFVGRFLDTLALPLTTKIEIRVFAEEEEYPAIPHFSAQFLPVCVGARSLECRITDDSVDPTGIIVIGVRRDPFAASPDVVLWINSPYIYQRVYSMFAYAPVVPGSDLEHFTLQYDRCPRSAGSVEWEAVFVHAKFESLRVLTVIDSPRDHLEELFDALMAAHPEDPRFPRCYCPRLETLHIRGVRCTELFWRKLRRVAVALRPALRMIKITEAGGVTDVADSLVREVRGLVESFELVRMERGWAAMESGSEEDDEDEDEGDDEGHESQEESDIEVSG